MVVRRARRLLRAASWVSELATKETCGRCSAILTGNLDGVDMARSSVPLLAAPVLHYVSTIPSTLDYSFG